VFQVRLSGPAEELGIFGPKIGTARWNGIVEGLPRCEIWPIGV